jgi:capsular exopolysaccharide synthesis family protein
MTEADRAKEVERIYNSNGLFSQYDAELERQAEAAVRAGAASRNDAARSVRSEKEKLRKAIVDRLARVRDDAGPFAAEGVRKPLDQIIADIQDPKRISFETIAGPLDRENAPEIVNLIQVRATFNRDAAARLYANMICVAFIDFYESGNETSIAAQIEKLKEMQRRAEEDLAQARQSLKVYLESNRDISPLSADQGAAIATAAQYEAARNSLQQEVRAAAAQVQVYQNLLADEQALQRDVLPSEEDPQVRALEARLAEARIAFDTVAASNKGEASFEYKEAKAKLDAARSELARMRAIPFSTSRRNTARDALKAQLGTAQVKLRDAQQRLETIQGQLAAAKAKEAKIPTAQARLADLRRKVALNEATISEIERTLSKYELAQVGNTRAGTITISGPAVSTDIGAGPNQRWMLMVYGAVLALVFGVALVVAMDALDNSIRSTTDVEKLLGLPICGVIPAQLPDPNRAPRITYLDPLSPAAEAYRLLRTDLLFTAEERPFKSLMLCTGKPGQGATTTVCNLAIAMAQAGKRVILVDADLRRPKLHNVFKVKNDTGLTSLLNDECEIEEALKATEIDNLLLLPSGPLPLNPSELLASPKMRALHEQLKPHTDFILFDTPSAIAFSDSAVLASFLDAVLMVIRANNVPRGSEQQVKAILNKAKANILGVVLNGMNPEHVDSVHYHYHYYPLLAAKGALPASLPSSNGNGHHHGGGGSPGAVPLALPGDGEGVPVSARAGAATAEGGSPEGVAAAAAPAGEKTQSFTSPALSQPQAVPEPFLEAHRRSWWKRFKGAIPFLVGAIVIGLIVLLLSSAVAPGR